MGSTNRRFLTKVAKEEGLAAESVTLCMNRKLEKNFVLDEDAADIKDLGVQESPVFFVNGIRVFGFEGPDKLKEIIAQELRLAHLGKK